MTATQFFTSSPLAVPVLPEPGQGAAKDNLSAWRNVKTLAGAGEKAARLVAGWTGAPTVAGSPKKMTTPHAGSNPAALKTFTKIESGVEVTCWYVDQLCDTCQQPMATDGREVWCPHGNCKEEQG